MIRACDVHAILWGDYEPRETRYCSLCDAHLCEECRTSAAPRVLAAIERLIRRLRNAV